MRFLLAITLFMSISMQANAYECFRKDEIRRFDVRGHQLIKLYGLAHDYLVEVSFCTNLLFADNIGFDTFPEQSKIVCAGDDLLILDFSGEVRDQCPIWHIERTNWQSKQ